jgi:hypothetical protein
MTHGFFVQMGGFMLVDGHGDPIRPLLPDDLDTLSEKEEIDFPVIKEAEITDKSKGDFLSKGLVLLQTGWFVVQCIARASQHLSLTELELVTLAFAVLNFVTYWLWWNKPLDARYPVSVKRRVAEPVEEVPAGRRMQG